MTKDEKRRLVERRLKSVLKRYGITLALYNGDRALKSLKINWGPQYAGVDLKNRRVMMTLGPGDRANSDETFGVYGANPLSDILHEAGHIIFANGDEERLTEPEYNGQLQLEMALAKIITNGVPAAMRDVKHYVDHSVLAQADARRYLERSPLELVFKREGILKEVNNGRYMMSKLWRDGTARAKKLGVLSPQGHPTWRNPNYDAA